jgi:hypothetical protein
MYEIRKAGKQFRIYDRNTKRYVGYTRNSLRAEEILYNLQNAGFEGEIPSFMLDREGYGINFDVSY